MISYIQGYVSTRLTVVTTWSAGKRTAACSPTTQTTRQQPIATNNQ